MNDNTLTDKDALNHSSGVHDEAFVAEYGRIEAIRASRYSTSFSVILADAGSEPGKKASVKETEALRSAFLGTLRGCDVVGTTEYGSLLAILPETDYFGSLVTIRKLIRALANADTGARGQHSVISQATFPKDGRSFISLVAAARAKAASKKDSLWEKHGLGGLIFWEAVGELASGSFKSTENASFDAGTGQTLSEFFMDQINELVLKDIIRNQHKRGIMYLASRRVSSSMSAARFLNLAPAFKTKVFLVGDADESAWEIKNATPIVIDDPRLKETFFTFYLGEDTGYALICKENWGGIYSCFHTSDTTIVEGLIAKLQTEYSLQEQLG